MKKRFRVFRLIKRNFLPLIGYELLFKAVIYVLATAALRELFQISLNITGIGYFSSDTLKNFFASPFSIVFGIMILFGLAWISLFNITGVIQCLMASEEDRTLHLPEMIRAGIRTSNRVIQPRNWFVIVFLILILPLTGLADFAGTSVNYSLPPFIVSYINDNDLLGLIATVGIIVLIVMARNWLFSFHAFMFESKTFDQARKRSAALLKGRSTRATVSILLYMLFVLLLYGLSFVIGIAVISLIVRYAVPEQNRLYTALTVIPTAVMALSYLGELLYIPVIFGKITDLYLDYSLKDGKRKLPETEEEMHQKQLLEVSIFMEENRMEEDFSIRGKEVASILPAKIIWTAYFLVVAFAAVAGLRQDVLDFKTHFFPGMGKPTTMVAAHRGDSASAPENSIPAFQKAIEDKADWIELDVHETKDGVIVVTHDPDLKRIGGVNKLIPDLTYDELETYDVGSWFSSEYKDLHVATLDEVIKLAKGKIRLNIEIKPSTGDHELEEKIIGIIRDNHFENDCVLASLNRDSLIRVKELDPELKTLYIMAFAAGDIEKADFADGFSLEEGSVTQEVVNRVHKNGKKIWVWTINDSDKVDDFREMGVDYILTDDPVMARATILSSGMNQGLVELFTYIFGKPGTVPAAPGA